MQNVRLLDLQFMTQTRRDIVFLDLEIENFILNEIVKSYYNKTLLDHQTISKRFYIDENSSLSQDDMEHRLKYYLNAPYKIGKDYDKEKDQDYLEVTIDTEMLYNIFTL